MNHINYYQVDLILFKNGEDSALARIWERIQNLVKKQIAEMFPSVSPRSVCFEEMISNAYLAVWRSAKRFDVTINKNFTTFALFAVRNALIDVAKSEFRFTATHVFYDAILDLDRDGAFAIDHLLILSNTSIWGWVPAADAEILYNEVAELLFNKLTGTSFMILFYKRLGEVDQKICKILKMSLELYDESLQTLRKEVSYILINAGYNNCGVLSAKR